MTWPRSRKTALRDLAMTMFLLLLVLHVAITIAMTGIIWFVQLVHYPMIMTAQTTDVPRLESFHWKKTMPLAILMLTLELVTGIVVTMWAPVSMRLMALIGIGLILAIWATTWGVCVPAHCDLKGNCSASSVKILMKSNLFRAVLWSFRSLIVVGMLANSVS